MEYNRRLPLAFCKAAVTIDLMHDDVTRPEGSMGVVVTLKFKMAASSASSGGNSKIIVSFDLSESSNKSPEPLLDGPATSEHMSALLPFKFPVSGKNDAILDSFVTTTATMHVRDAKALFYVIMHEVYLSILVWRRTLRVGVLPKNTTQCPY